MNSIQFRNLMAGLLTLTIFLASCSGEPEKTAVPAVKVAVIDVIKKDVPVFQEFVGEISGLYDIPIRARVDGFLEEIYFREGSEVMKDQLLYLIDAQPYLAEVASKKSDVSEAKTLLVNAENQLRRIQPLAEINAVSKSDLDAAIADEGAARAALEASQANLKLSEINLNYTHISAPIGGVIGKTLAKQGEYVGKIPNPVILNTISRIDTVLVQFFITENDYLKFAREFIELNGKIETERNQGRKENLELILADGTVHKFPGSIDFIDREVDATTGSILIQASFPNPEALLRPGQFARVKVHIRTEKEARLIPLRCIIEIQGEKNVFVYNEAEQSVQLRKIKSSALYGDLVLVAEGLNHGEKVVLEGLQRIRSGVKVTPEQTTFESKSNNPF